MFDGTVETVPGSVRSSAVLKPWKAFPSASYSYWSAVCRVRIPIWCRSSQTSRQVAGRRRTFKRTIVEHPYAVMWYTHTVLVRALLKSSHSRFGAISPRKFQTEALEMVDFSAKFSTGHLLLMQNHLLHMGIHTAWQPSQPAAYLLGHSEVSVGARLFVCQAVANLW